MYICHECGRDNSNNIPKAQDGKKLPPIPYSNEYLDSLEKDYLKMYNDPNTEMDDGFDKFYHSLIDDLPQVPIKSKGWIINIPGSESEEFINDDGNTPAPKATKNRTVTRVEDYVEGYEMNPNTRRLGNLASYMQQRAINKLDNRTVSNKGYDIDTPKQKNGGWLDNYNDSKASAPEGMVGDGFSNVGRNYSPAWGGQFEDGGLVPIAQGGRATSADSLNIYNDVMRTKKYYETNNTKYFEKPDISPGGWFADKERMSKVQKQHLAHPDVTAANKQKIRQNKNPNQYLLSDMVTGAIDKNAPLFRYDTRIAPQGQVTYKPKTYLQPALKKLDPNYDKLSVSDQMAIEDMLTGYADLLTPEEKLIYRKWKGKHPHDFKKMEALSKLDREVSNNAPGYITTLPYYDPLAVKPYSLRTPEEKIEWKKKYGPTKTKDKPNKITSIQRPKLEAIENNIQPQVVNSDFDSAAQLPVLRPDARTPKSFDINSQRQTMSGPSNYYDYDQQGLSLEQATKAAQAAEVYNQSIQDKYGNSKNPKAQERLKQLRQNVEVTPQYQMGGSVYPVNYVPQAQLGLNIGAQYETYGDDAASDLNSFNPHYTRINDSNNNNNNNNNNNIDYSRRPGPDAQPYYESNYGESNRGYMPWHNTQGMPLEMSFQEISNTPIFRYLQENIKTNPFFKTRLEDNPYYGFNAPDKNINYNTSSNYSNSEPLIVDEKNISPSWNIKQRNTRLEGRGGTYDNTNTTTDNIDVVNQAKRKADIFNKSIQEKYGDSPNPKAQERARILRNDVEVTPQYQMGGSIPGATGNMYARVGAPSNGPYAKKTMASAQDGKKLNPFTYPQPDHYSTINPFIFKDPQHDIFIGGINPTYSTKDFSVGASMVGVGNKDFQKLPADYGIRGSYNPSENFSINANLSKNNVGAGMSYRFENGGEVAQNGQEMQYYQNGLDFQPKTISKNGGWLDGNIAQTGEQTFPSNNKSLQILTDIQKRKNKKTIPIKIKDDRRQVMNPSESTAVKKRDFDAEQSKSSKAYYNAVVTQKKEDARRKGLTQDQREREDYNIRNEQTGSIQPPVEESNWDRTKAIVSNPLTAFGYAARNESLPTRFQHGERNTLDNAIDWINPLQGIASASEIPGELGRGEYLNAGLSALDAADLGIFAKGAKKLGNNQLRNLSPAMGFKEGGIIKDDRGQWDHPGEITEINSNQITMGPDPKTGKPLTKPLLGISDTGDVKLMRPGGNYKFDGKRVTEYPIAQAGKNIKLKNEKGEVETINTASPEYEEIYKAGNIQSPGAGEGDNPYFGGELPEVVVQQQMTPLLQAKKDYEQLSNEEAFTNRKKDEYIKSLGSSNWFGADRNNFPESVLRDINAEYEYNKNTKAIEDVAKKKGFDLNTRGNWIYDLTPSEKEALVNSRYSAQLNPNEFAEMASGVQQLANTMTIGKPWDFDIPGLTQRELEEDRESSLSGLKTFAPLNMPGNLVANYLKNSSDYVENPYGGVQRMGNVDVWDSMAMNPLNLSMITGASKLLAGVPGAVRSVPGAVKTIGKGLADVKENAPAAMDFAKDAVKDVRGVVKQYKEIGKIKNQDAHYNSVVSTSKLIDDIPKTGMRASGTITDSNELYSIVTTLSDNFKVYLKRMGGKEFAETEAYKWEQNFRKSDLAKRLEDVIDQGKQVSPDELKQLGREFSNSFPEGKSFIGPAKKELTKVQKNLIFNRDEDYDTLKEFAKNLKIKIPKRPDKVEYSPKEKETIDAIRELGKYKSVANYQKDKLLADPEAMANINKVILKLDDDVIENLLNISKGKLLDSYKNVVPNIKKTQVDITSNPIPTSDLSLVNEENLIQQGVVDDIHPFNEKPLLTPELKYQSLIERIGQSYAKNFEPVNYKAPSSYPESLIGMAKTDYQYDFVKDAANNLLFDANNNAIQKLVPQGNVKQQLIKALRKVQASPKGTNFIGSGSLSTDSYPLTLDSGIMMSDKGLVDVGVETGTMYLNDMGYTHMSPRLVIKDINSKIEQLEKLSGKKLPRAKYDPKADKYHMYKVPKIYFTRLKQGGSINKADENSLVKLDNLTNFTNYNKPQPGSWLEKYN
jgi:hypothetical protein